MNTGTLKGLSSHTTMCVLLYVYSVNVYMCIFVHVYTCIFVHVYTCKRVYFSTCTHLFHIVPKVSEEISLQNKDLSVDFKDQL